MNTSSVIKGTFLILAVGATTGARAGDERVDLRARVTGYLTQVLVKAGDKVARGQLLFEIDARPYEAQAQLADAQCAAADARLQRCTAELTRAQALVKTLAISREDLQKITAERAEAEANKQTTLANRALARLNLEFTKVHAPVDGVISRTDISAGNLVKADDTLLGTIEARKGKSPQGKATSSAKVKELLKERLQLLTKLADLIEQQHRQGRAPLESIVQARRAALEASLELCATPAERMDVLRKDLQLAKSLLEIAQAGVESGRSPQTDALRARAIVLDAQIRLLREEEKAKTGK